jgi:Serine/threonine protein phosphatase
MADETVPYRWSRWTSVSQSHIGKVRKHNEDAFLDLPGLGLWVVADGMGGHAAGDVASRAIVDSLRNVSPPSSLAAFVADVRDRLKQVNRKLRAQAMERQEPVIGSTVAVLLAVDHHCACLWAGDSRIYLFRDGRLQQLTRDHSYVEQLIADGLLQREEANDHPQANAITRAVGCAEHFEVDVEIQEVGEGDIFLLCSDGLNREVSDAEIASVLSEYDIDQAVHALVGMTLSRGARDNVTLVIAQAGPSLTTSPSLL